MAGDEARIYPLPLHLESVRQRLLPERLAPLHQHVATPYVVHQNIQPAILLPLHPSE
ncbi:hypothetical protein D3C73_1482800 [compost metagenome]